MEIETKNYVLICNKIDSTTFKEMKHFEIENFSIKVELLIDEIAKFFNLDKNCFDVVCFGQLLDYSNTLESYGIENGTLLYLWKKKIPQSPTPSTSKGLESPGLSLEHQGHCLALKTALLTPKFRGIIRNLSDFENRENLITINRELRNDPSIFGLLGDAELLHAFIAKDNIKKVLKRYPNFLEVLTYASASFHEEMTSMSSNSRSMGYRGSSMNFSIDAISDDDEDALYMEDNQELQQETSSISSNNTNNSGLQSSDSQTFANILMQAYNHQRRQSQRQRNDSQNIITADMLSQALQSTSSTSSSNADLTQTCECQCTIPNVPNVAGSSNNNDNQESSGLVQSSSSDCIPQPPPPPGPPQPDNRTTAQILIGYAPQLRQMRELGINDDIVAIQALEATNGDVQAAINIIFSDMN